MLALQSAATVQGHRVGRRNLALKPSGERATGRRQWRHPSTIPGTFRTPIGKPVPQEEPLAARLPSVIERLL
jgi:hypothetical protein